MVQQSSWKISRKSSGYSWMMYGCHSPGHLRIGFLYIWSLSLEVLDNFCYLGDLISSGGRGTESAIARIEIVREEPLVKAL